jgi:hypothetical protein
VAESGVIAAEMEEVVDLIMGCREEALGLAGGFELLHLSLPVRASAGPNSLLGCLIPCAGDVQCGLTSLFAGVAGKLVCDYDAGRPHLLLQQLANQPLGRALVTPALDQNVEHNAGLVHGSPQPVTPAILSTTSSRCHLSVQARNAMTDPVGELLAEFARPLPHGFMAYDDAAGGQQLLNHAQPEREPEVQPDGTADDLGREAIPGIGRYPTRLHMPVRQRTPCRTRQADVPTGESTHFGQKWDD